MTSVCGHFGFLDSRILFISNQMMLWMLLCITLLPSNVLMMQRKTNMEHGTWWKSKSIWHKSMVEIHCFLTSGQFSLGSMWKYIFGSFFFASLAHSEATQCCLFRNKQDWSQENQNNHELTSCRLIPKTLDGYYEKTIHSMKFLIRFSKSAHFFL